MISIENRNDKSRQIHNMAFTISCLILIISFGVITKLKRAATNLVNCIETIHDA